jgi:hypothetical protein
MAIHYSGKVFRNDKGQFVKKDRGLKSSIARGEYKEYQRWFAWLERDKTKEADRFIEAVEEIFKARPVKRIRYDKSDLVTIEDINQSFKPEKLVSPRGKIDRYLETWNDDYGNEDDYTSGGSRK